uniref:Transmembrane protein 39A n=3 Tax=Schistocephalus solidus TaxID=70667 RepID=A0A0V0JBE7_SCHSO
MGGPKRPSHRGTAQFQQKSAEAKQLDPVRHVTLPPVPYTGCINFHFFRLTFCLVAMLLQYLNLYRTVWWLPKLKARFILDLEAIDKNLVAHVLLFLIVSPLFEAMQRLHWRLTTHLQACAFYLLLAKGSFAWAYAQYLLICGIHFERCVIPVRACGLLFLMYMPLASLVLLYNETVTHACHQTLKLRKLHFTFAAFFKCFHEGLRFSLKSMKPRRFGQLAKQAYATVIACRKAPSSGSGSCGRIPRHSVLLPLRYATLQTSSISFYAIGTGGSSRVEMYNRELLTFYSVRPPNRQIVALSHNCLKVVPDAPHVRDEVDLLRQDFNARLTDTLVGTMSTTFYTTIVPCLFVRPADLNYDLRWCAAHCLMTAGTLFLLHWQYLLPPTYIDRLHRSALHLGCWEPCSNGTTTQTAGSCNWQPWSQFQVYGKGVLVKHVRGQFRSLENTNAAEPGNLMHSRFYFWFVSPILVPNLLCALSLVLVLCQLFSLEWVFEWYKLLNLAAVCPFSLMNVYRLVRNRFLLCWVYESDSFDLSTPSPDACTGISSSAGGGGGGGSQSQSSKPSTRGGATTRSLKSEAFF